MTEPVAVVKVKAPRSVVARLLTPVSRTQTNSLLPLLVPASIAAAGMIWGLLRRRTRAIESAQAEITVAVVAVVHRVIEFR